MQKLFATNTKNCIIVGYPATFFLATIICYKYKNDLPQIQKIVLQLVIMQLPSWPPLFASNTKIICHKYKNYLQQIQKVVLRLVIVQLLPWPPLFAT